jgi:hypothetical protein
MYNKLKNIKLPILPFTLIHGYTPTPFLLFRLFFFFFFFSPLLTNLCILHKVYVSSSSSVFPTNSPPTPPTFFPSAKISRFNLLDSATQERRPREKQRVRRSREGRLGRAMKELWPWDWSLWSIWMRI